jgi:hypothetical protein
MLIILLLDKNRSNIFRRKYLQYLRQITGNISNLLPDIQVQCQVFCAIYLTYKLNLSRFLRIKRDKYC